MNQDEAEKEVKNSMAKLDELLAKMHADEDIWFAKNFGEEFAIRNRKNYNDMVAWLRKDLARIFGDYPDKDKEELL